ncbi:MAG TPA: hypothetical protein VMF09_11360, partial [Solirubrobacteraceae bacterium]|nr:hypothetical protein [Solirubrobacteraceae bacterium]
PKRGQSLADAIAEYDAAGFNAINFLEFTFIPTRESPDHDRPDFQKTMRWYYPVLPRFPHRLNAWKRQDAPVELQLGGHVVDFPGLKMAPTSLYMRHYMYLSEAHALEKFVRRGYAADEVERGWHRWRSKVRPEHIRLPSERQLRRYEADHLLDPSKPRKRHLLEDRVEGGRTSAELKRMWRRAKRLR